MAPSPHNAAPSTQQPQSLLPEQLQAYGNRGIERCRRGDWEAGIADLMTAAGHKGSVELSSLVYSYLGLGIARHRSEIKEGLKLCQHAIKLEFFQPDNYFNLAQVYLITQQRKEAVAAVRRGLGIDQDHQGLRRLQVRMGIRNRQVIRFLTRGHFLNQILGRVRHKVRTRSAIAAAAARQKAESRRQAALEGARAKAP